MLIRTILTSAAAVALLSGCSTFPTNFMPNGYTYEDDTPITSPGPTTPWLNDAVLVNTDQLASNQAAWQGAVFELVDKVAANLSPADGPIVLLARTPASNQKQAFDHYLRQALIQRGFAVTTQPGPGPTLVYDVLPMKNEVTREFAAQRLGKDAIFRGNMEGIYLLRVTSVAQPAIDEAVVAVLAEEQSESGRWPGMSSQPVQGKSLKTAPIYENRD
jgi:hypothetical protein